MERINRVMRNITYKSLYAVIIGIWNKLKNKNKKTRKNIWNSFQLYYIRIWLFAFIFA